MWNLSLLLSLIVLVVLVSAKGSAMTSTRTIRQLQTDCKDAMANNDDDNDLYLNRTEYIGYVNDLSNQAYSGVTDWENLPTSLKANFVYLYLKTDSNGRQVAWNIRGSTSGQAVSQQQADFLQMACDETFMALGLASPTPSPTPNAFDEGPSTTNSFENVTLERLECFFGLALADEDSNFMLTQGEYLDYVRVVSNNAISADSFPLLPAVVRTNFVNFASSNNAISIVGARFPQDPNATTDQLDRLVEICNQTSLAVSVALAQPPSNGDPVNVNGFNITVETLECFFAMAFADENGDSLLVPLEFVAFVGFLANTDTLSDFDDLSLLLRVVFDAWATPQDEMSMSKRNIFDSETSAIDIFGAYYPQQNATRDQLENLEGLCIQTNAALPSLGLPDSPTAAPVPPTPSPTGGGSDFDGQGAQYTVNELQCLFGLALVDVNTNDLMDEDEYVDYVNFLIPPTEESFDGYDDLPLAVRTNYVFFAKTNNQISIQGAHYYPVQDPSNAPSNLEELLQICNQTSTVVANNLESGGGGTPAPTPVPPVIVTPDLLECLYALALSDGNRDLYLNQQDYADFVFLASNFYEDEDYGDLPLLLRANYAFFATDTNPVAGAGEISVFGSYYPQQHTNVSREEVQVLEFLCDQTIQLVWDINGVTPSPTMAPVPSPPPTTPLPTGPTPPPSPSQVRVASEFFISNTAGLTAADSSVGSDNWNNLEEAYDMTAQQVVEEEEQSRGRRSVRQRRLVEYVSESGRIDGIRDSSCPDEEEGSDTEQTTLCQTVSASFLVELEDGDDLSASEAEDLYTESMNDAIKNGDLEENLKAVNPDSPFTVIATDAEIETDDSSDDGANVGVILASVFGGLAFLVVLVLLWRFYKFCQESHKEREREAQERLAGQDYLADDGPHTSHVKSLEELPPAGESPEEIEFPGTRNHEIDQLEQQQQRHSDIDFDAQQQVTTEDPAGETPERPSGSIILVDEDGEQVVIPPGIIEHDDDPEYNSSYLSSDASPTPRDITDIVTDSSDVSPLAFLESNEEEYDA